MFSGSSEADGFHHDATRESVYDVYEKLNNCDFRDSARFDQLIAERNRIYEGSVEEDEKYEKYYKELEQMIMKARKEREGE